MKTIKIIMEKDQELTNDFADSFTKIIMNNNQYIYLSQLDQYDTLTFKKFHDFVVNSSNFKNFGPKSPSYKLNHGLSFQFRAKQNNIIMLLDISSYMLIYNYGTRSFPLKNLQSITSNLLNKLVQLYNKDRSYQYSVSIYLFSIYRQNLDLLVFNEKITQNNIQLLCQFINKTIQKSKIPYEKSLMKETIHQKIQNLLNRQESYIGMKNLIVISSFHEEQISSYYLFTPNWYVYGLINTGGHFGSYIINNQQIENKLMVGSYMKNNYVFKAEFLQNWEMTDRKKQEDPQRTEPVTGKFGSVIYENGGRKYQQIFDLILRYKIVMKDFKKKVIHGDESVMSSIKQYGNRMIYKRQYKLPADSFSYILRTKYAQGWQPVIMSYSGFIEASKFKLCLSINQNMCIYYEAKRNQNDFLITIYNPNPNKGRNQINSNNEKLYLIKQLINNIQKLDIINSYNFNSFINENLKIKSIKNPFRRNNQIFGHNRSYQIMNDICNNVSQWGKYFIIKRICFQFQPNLTNAHLNELINQIRYILGKKVNKLIFVKQIQGDRKANERFDDIDSLVRKVMITKINIFGNIIQLQLAFMRYNYYEIQRIIDSLINKINNSKFKWGTAKELLYQLVFYLKYNHDISNMFFNHQWILKCKTKYYMHMFKILWMGILKAKLFKNIPFKNQAFTSHYYKIVQMKLKFNQKIQKAVFLKVKQSEEKDNQITFHIFMCPSLVQVYPFFKEYNQQSKCVNMRQMATIFAKQLKKTQSNIIKLLDTYQNIHNKLINSLKNSWPKIMNQPLQKLNYELYDIKHDPKTGNFKASMIQYCKKISNKYYRQSNEQPLSTIPFPTKFLMTTQLQKLQGDVDLQIDNKKYSFFFCTPYKIIYLYKQQSQIFYKIINMYFEEFNIKQTQSDCIDIFLKEIKYNITQQIYCNDFKIFLDGNYKLGIAKIIDNQFFTHNQEKIIQINSLYKYVPQNLASIQNKQKIYKNRLKRKIDTFSQKLFILIQQFFPLLRVNYYFQIRKQQKQIPFGIDGSISRVDSQLFMRLVYICNDLETDVTTPYILSGLILNQDNPLNMKDHLKFRFYLKKKNNSQRSIIFIDYFISYIQQLIKEMSYRIETIYITKLDQLYQFAFRQQNTTIEKVELALIRKESQNRANLCNVIQTNIMKHYLPFKKITNHTQQPQFMIIQQEHGFFTIKQNLVMKIANGILMFMFRLSIFFVNQQSQIKVKIQEYLQKLKNFINASILMKQLVENGELPLQPYELWLHESVNSPSNKKPIDKKKKKIKNPVTKYFKKANLSEVTAEKPTNMNTLENSKLVYLNMIYRHYIPLNDRVAKKQSLNSIKQDQIFHNNQILNLYNTYLFEQYFKKNNIIFHFEQIYDQLLIKQISQENYQSHYHKCQKYLVYYAFCLDPLVTKNDIQYKISQHLKLILRNNQFGEVSNHLAKHHDIIENYQEYFIRGSDHDKEKGKEYKFQVPTYMDKDQLAFILIQSLQIYHDRVKFRSQSNLTKNVQIFEAGNAKILESIRVEQPNKLQQIKDQCIIKSKLKRGLSVKDEINQSLSISPHYFNRLKSFQLKQSNLSESMSYSKHLQSSLSSFCQSDYYHTIIQYLPWNWLFNWAKKPEFSHKFGKCLYFLKIKKQDSNNLKMIQRNPITLNKNIYLFSNNFNQTNEMKKLLLMPKKNLMKMFKKDLFIKNNLILQITDFAGTIEYNEISNNFYNIFTSSLGQYYIQKYFYLEFTSMKYNYNQISTVNEQTDEDSEIQSNRGGSSMNEVYQALLEWPSQLNTINNNISSLALLKIQSSDALMKNKFIYFTDFFNEFFKIIRHYHQKQDLPILLYFQLQNQQYQFLNTQFSKSNLILQMIHKMSQKQVETIGFIITDYLLQINAHFQNSIFAKNQQKEIKISHRLQFLKMFGDISLGSDSAEKFKRSILINYQINQSQFLYESYNLRHEINNDIKLYLKSIECWLHQKMKVYKFIKNVKENNKYESEKIKDKFKKVDSFYQIALSNINYKQPQLAYKQDTPQYNLLINIIFKDFPKQMMKEQKEQAKLGLAKQKIAMQKTRIKYYHHCKQTQAMLQVLKNNPVNYNKYSPYKGNEKFLLERLGREYVSLLRQQYKVK